MSKSINEPITDPEVIIGLAGVGGCISISLDDLAEYNADPDGWAARYLGVTVDQYREYIESDYTPLCGAITKAGKPCRCALGCSWDIVEWLALHRKSLCGVHANRRQSEQTQD